MNELIIDGVDFSELMTAAEVAEAFDVSERTVTRWGQTGRLASIVTPGGRCRRFSRAQVEELLKPIPLGADGTRRLVGVRETAAILQVNRSTVVYWADKGRLTSIRTPGGELRLDAAEVQQAYRAGLGVKTTPYGRNRTGRRARGRGSPAPT